MEQYVRDNRINMIYEGTNTIQSLDLLGRKVLADNGKKLKAFGRRIAEFAEDAGRFGIRLQGSVKFPGDVSVTLLFGEQEWIGDDAGITAADVLIEDGRIVEVGAIADPGDATILDAAGRLILPGLVDTHCHYPQSGIIASFGRQLLDWLEQYTFPAEMAFADREVARASAEHFVQRMLAHGTTTASVFATVHALRAANDRLSYSTI